MKNAIANALNNVLVKAIFVSLFKVWMKEGRDHALRVTYVNMHGNGKSWATKSMLMGRKALFDLFRPMSIVFFCIFMAVFGETVTAWVYGFAISAVALTVVFPQLVINGPSSVQHRMMLKMNPLLK